MNIGPMEIAIVLILALLVFGPKRLPQAGRSLGQAMRELRKATQAARNDLGIDQMAADVKDLKASMGVDEVAAGVKDLKSSMTIDLKAADAASQSTGATATPTTHGSAAGTDLTPDRSTASDSSGTPVDAPPAAGAAAPRRRFGKGPAVPTEAAQEPPPSPPPAPPRRKFGKGSSAASAAADAGVVQAHAGEPEAVPSPRPRHRFRRPSSEAADETPSCISATSLPAEAAPHSSAEAVRQERPRHMFRTSSADNAPNEG